MEKIKPQLEYFVIETKSNCYVFKTFESATKKIKALITTFDDSIMVHRFEQMKIEDYLSTKCMVKNIRIEE